MDCQTESGLTRKGSAPEGSEMIAERIGNAPDLARRIDQKQIEADAGPPPIGILCQQDLRRRQQSRSLTRGQRVCRHGQRWPSFHFR